MAGHVQLFAELEWWHCMTSWYRPITPVANGSAQTAPAALAYRSASMPAQRPKQGHSSLTHTCAPHAAPGQQIKYWGSNSKMNLSRFLWVYYLLDMRNSTRNRMSYFDFLRNLPELDRSFWDFLEFPVKHSWIIIRDHRKTRSRNCRERT